MCSLQVRARRLPADEGAGDADGTEKHHPGERH